MEELTFEQAVYLRLYGIPEKAIELINNYLPKENEDFGKNFGQSSPHEFNDPIFYFGLIFEVLAKVFNIKLDIVTHLCGDAYIVNPKSKFKLQKINNIPDNLGQCYFITTNGYGKYTQRYKKKLNKGDSKWKWILKK